MMTTRRLVTALAVAVLWWPVTVAVAAEPPLPQAATATQEDPPQPAREANPGRRGRPGGPRAGGPGRQAPPSPERRTVAEVEQLFDTYVMRQARQFLRLTPDQVPQFNPRLRQLQMARRRAARQHQMLVRELNELTAAGAAQDEGAITAKMAAIEQQNAAGEQDVREAYQRLEQVLTVQQRARMVVFEQQMERTKLDLMARAREVARGRGRGAPDGQTPDVPAADVSGTR